MCRFAGWESRITPSSSLTPECPDPDVVWQLLSLDNHDPDALLPIPYSESS